MTRLADIAQDKKTALTVTVVAALLHVTERRVYGMVAGGEIPHFRVGRHVRFDPELFGAWLRQRVEKPKFKSLSEVLAEKADARRAPARSGSQGRRITR